MADLTVDAVKEVWDGENNQKIFVSSDLESVAHDMVVGSNRRARGGIPSEVPFDFEVDENLEPGTWEIRPFLRTA